MSSAECRMSSAGVVIKPEKIGIASRLLVIRHSKFDIRKRGECWTGVHGAWGLGPPIRETGWLSRRSCRHKWLKVRECNECGWNYILKADEARVRLPPADSRRSSAVERVVSSILVVAINRRGCSGKYIGRGFESRRFHSHGTVAQWVEQFFPQHLPRNDWSERPWTK